MLNFIRRNLVMALIVGTSAVLVVGALTGCPIVAPALDCAMAIDDDAAKQMPLPQLISDVSKRCGADVGTIILALLTSKNPVTLSSRAHNDAVKLASTLKTVDVDGGK